MKALVYNGPGAKAWEHVPAPILEVGTDAIVHVDATTICGTDLHILQGDLPTAYDIFSRASDTGALKVVLDGA
jgi:alcohol dehydrogenase